MENYRHKLEHLKWLRSTGVDFFLTDTKDFKSNLIEKALTNCQDKAIKVNNSKEDSKILGQSTSNQDTLDSKTIKPISTIKSRPLSKLADVRQVQEVDGAQETAMYENVHEDLSTGTTPQLSTRVEFQKRSSVTQAMEGTNYMIKKARQVADMVTTLSELKQQVYNFDGCDLKKFAENTVFSDGNPEAKVLLIGEAPGATEDKMGVPFCGESGMLLDKMLEAIGIYRSKNAYITNTVFWRPPANRRPTQEEIDICRPLVEKHIALIDPKLIILVGSTAATSLLGKHEGISNIRNNSYNYINPYLQSPIHMTAIFHPAYLLRQPMQKKTTWFDLIKIQQFITENGIPL